MNRHRVEVSPLFLIVEIATQMTVLIANTPCKKNCINVIALYEIGLIEQNIQFYIHLSNEKSVERLLMPLLRQYITN